jgi:hypothetical protein
MRAIVLAAMLFAALLLFGNAAQAAPWCAHFSTGFNDCSFYSFRQCMATISGVGGYCLQNTLETPYRTGGDARRRYGRSY